MTAQGSDSTAKLRESNHLPRRNANKTTIQSNVSVMLFTTKVSACTARRYYALGMLKAKSRTQFDNTKILRGIHMHMYPINRSPLYEGSAVC